MNQKDIDGYRENSFDLYQKAAFYELLSESMIKKWSQFDTGTKLLLVITAPGSAFAGWVLWSTTEGKFIWATIAVVVSIASGANASMKVPDRIKEWEERRNKSSEIVSSIESFRRLLKICDDDKMVKTEYTNLENRWRNSTTLFKSTDILITNKITNEVNNKLNQNINERRYNK